MKKSALLIIFIMVLYLNICVKSQSITDYDGNVYQTVQIGNQVWMAENLKTTKYNNGDTIDTTYPYDKDISTEIDPKYQWPVYLGEKDKSATYGLLYTWYTATDSRNVCPTNWHLPSMTEFYELINYLGGENIAGNKMKEPGTEHWTSDNLSDNSSGFTGLPAGIRSESGNFNQLMGYGYWWSATDKFEGIILPNSGYAYLIGLIYDESRVYISDALEQIGLSIRCIKDNISYIPTDQSKELIIYPNPALDEIKIGNINQQNITVSLYSLTGECKIQKQITEKEVSINICQLAKGVYIMKIENSQEIIQKKLIKN